MAGDTFTITDGYRRTEEAFREACIAAGRGLGEVKLIAVSKTFPAEAVREAYGLGQRLFGENRAQELTEKQPVLPKDIEWHFIGRLQRNKVKYIIDKAAMIHSVDSAALAREISRQALLKQVEASVLIEVNLDGEETKAGFGAEGLRQGLEEIAALPGVHVLGLMTIGQYHEDPEGSRALFRRMRALRDEAASWAVPGADIRYLSMGMSHDFEAAIAEGADYVRVGTAIFGGR
ncbi:MAG: YggS family pyridoxal phosphate-dependent enzyme [Clostridiales bacterium]|nr:YggS family pyridoxal phosphate-dependent enzyme [Clostridiales bacterium]